MNKIVKNWVATSNYDLQTADAMYKVGRYLYVVFMCHLAIEKMLKALLSHKYPENVPPKIHNLINLAQRAEVTIPDNLTDFYKGSTMLVSPPAIPKIFGHCQKSSIRLLQNGYSLIQKG